MTQLTDNITSQPKSVISVLTDELNPLIERWIYRILCSLKAENKFIGQGDFYDEELAIALKFTADTSLYHREGLLKKLRKRHKALESVTAYSLPAALKENIANLAEHLALNDIEQQLLSLILLLKSCQPLESATALLGNVPASRLPQVFAVILGLPVKPIKAALGSGILIHSGLIEVDRSGYSEIADRFSLITPQFADLMQHEHTSILSLLKGILQYSVPPELTLQHYPHLKTDIALLLPYLEYSVNQQRRGVNILLYGQPGTGKTQLVKVLANHLQASLFNISTEDEDTDAITGYDRLRAYRIAQNFLANSRSLLLFDETEDIFTGQLFNVRAKVPGKGWLNNMLEQNPVPAFWLTNDISLLDNALIRRFDMAIELPVPPKKQRTNMLKQAACGLLNEQDASCMAEHPYLIPAIISRSAGIIDTLIRYKAQPADSAAALRHLMNNTLQAQGFRPLPAVKTIGSTDMLFDTAFVNTPTDLTAIITGLQHSGEGRLCLYGAPGTGKTTFVRYLAQQLDMPLLIKQPSDILSAWAGESEKNLAAAFQQAAQKSAILLLDEADSFLQQRAKAQNHWEITLVNELLTQLENFEDIVVACTNAIGHLDSAALRRFDLKAAFRYLTPAQAVVLFCQCCQQLGLAYTDAELMLIRTLANLTPGDFAAILRQHRFHPLTSARQMAQMLTEECCMKTGISRPAAPLLN